MDILLDSNVIIELEGPDKILPESVAEMVRLSQELGYRLYSHPCQFDDLNRDSNENRRRIQLSKLKQYPSLVNPPLPNQFELLENGWGESSDNDRCDNLLLFAVKRSAVRFLITEDRRMHTKARRAGIGEQVFFIEEFLALLRQERARQLLTSNCAQVVTRFLYEIDVSDSFFDSLRLSYKGFDSWFNRCASEKRRAWAVEDGNRLSALCVFKEEKGDRNRRIGEFLKELDLAEARNTGYPVILGATKTNGSPKPILETNTHRDYFTFVLPIHEMFLKSDAETVRELNMADPVEGVNEGVNEGVKMLLAAIRKNPGKRTNELALLIGKSVQTVERYVKELKAAGDVEFRGAPKNGGYFIIDNEGR